MTDRSALHHRQAERFAELLDRASADGDPARCPHDDELAGLVIIRHRIEATAPQLEIDPTFRRTLRSALIATAVRDGIGATARPARTTPAHRRVRTPLRTLRRPRVRPGTRPRARVRALVGIAASVIAFAGLPLASEAALPGDVLYGLKRSAERAQVALAGSDISRGYVHLDLARTRLEEARTVTSGVQTLLADMDDDTRHGIRLLTGAVAARRDPAPLDAIDDFTVAQRGLLNELAGQVDGTDQARATGSLRLLDQVDERSAGLRHNLACPRPSVVRVDTLGPELGSCAAAMPLPYSLKKPPRQQPDGLPPRRDVAERAPRDPAGPAQRPAPDLPAPSGQSSATTPPTSAPSTSPPPDQDGPPGGGKPSAVPPPPAGDPPGQDGNQPEQGGGSPEQATQPQAAQFGPPEHVLLLRTTQLGPPEHVILLRTTQLGPPGHAAQALPTPPGPPAHAAPPQTAQPQQSTPPGTPSPATQPQAAAPPQAVQPAHPAQPDTAAPQQTTPPGTPEPAAPPAPPEPAAPPDRPEPAPPPDLPEPAAPPDQPEPAPPADPPEPAALPDRPEPAAPTVPPEQVAGAAADGLPVPDSGGPEAGVQEGAESP